MQFSTIVLGVCGGIAAYKAVEIVSRLSKQNIDVHVIMTKSAERFVTPLTFQAISNHPVTTDMFEAPQEWDIKHISLAQKADLILVAPATANMIGKIANGIADDMLTTTIMASNAMVVIVPAMNTVMYENRFVQENLEKLKSKGYIIMEPDFGRMACGTTGPGRLPEPEKIVEYIATLAPVKKDFENIKILLTAGPTIEPIDPVRYISNHSSGKMGYALAQEALKRGATVTLISGPVNIPAPKEAYLVQVKTAEEMHQAVMQEQEFNDIMIMVAAVSDYRCKNSNQSKIKKDFSEMTLELVKNPDIAYELGKLKNDRILVGFSAETDDLLKHAQSKMKNKNMDMIVANDVTKEGAGFLKDTNTVSILHNNGVVIEYPTMSKTEVANHILDEILTIYQRKM